MDAKSKLAKSKLEIALGLASTNNSGQGNEEARSFEEVVHIACERLELVKFNIKYPNISQNSQSLRGIQSGHGG